MSDSLSAFNNFRFLLLYSLKPPYGLLQIHFNANKKWLLKFSNTNGKKCYL
ncbi:hypothetical protein HDC91_002430 [Mucilaginibacter sp. AK015]|nr:hypothetical protein [Mucilaginibacter sp. AK015]